MVRCRDNRRSKKRMLRRQVRTLKKKIVKRLWHDYLCPDGKNPDYYEPFDIRFHPGSKPSWSKFKYKVRPNAKYRALMKELAEKCKGLTVDLSEFLNQGDQHE